MLDKCCYVAEDTDPTQNYDITVTGTVVESGIIAVQPGTTSLALTSDGVALSGSVYSPPIVYQTFDEAGVADDAGAIDGGVDGGFVGGCAIAVSQNGNQLSGTICGRTAGVSL